MTISVDLIDKILTECDNPQELLKEGGFIKQLTKALIERCLEAEMDDHLGYEKHQRSEQNKGNYRRLR
jgi:putative transposase